jgi:hypothetical protein
MCSSRRSRQFVGRLFLLSALAGLMGFSGGCNGGGNATLSAEDQAKAKEAARKKFDNFGAKQGRDLSR